jgi:predicted ATPase
MLNQLGDRWGEALSAQRSILRECFAEHDGHEMGTEGDSFFVVFSSAQSAFAAALAGQRRLYEHSWPDGAVLRVRMGLHTGEPNRHEEGYIGLDVHRAARIAATAHGGQVVVSAATRALIGEGDGSWQLRDLGWHRLKDMPGPEHLFDVVTADLPSEFPPLRSLGTRAHLPRYATELVGRTQELSDLKQILERPEVRLVTLTGPGGTGKTRLAVDVVGQFQEDYPCDIFFVPLDAADRAPLMWAGIADAVGAVGDADQSPVERAIGFLRDRTALLLLDNLEQIADADIAVSRLLNETADVRVLATSRRPLHLVDEQEYPVAPLKVPEENPQRYLTEDADGAIALFVRRAAMVRPGFRLTPDNVNAVVTLCRKLDGLPLAIELAAARSRFLSPQALVGRLDERLRAGVTAADRAERQRTLGATIAWSYDLLAPNDQRTFRRLGVFSSRVDLDAIAEVAAADSGDPLDAVAHLVDVSLVQVIESRDGQPMITLLETIRQFAREKLEESGECDEIRMRHARWCLQAATDARELLHGPQQTMALDRISAVEEDIRAALDWCLQADVPSSERRESGLAMLSAMSSYWYRFGYAAEGRGWTARGLAILESSEEPDSARFVDTLHGAAILGLQQSDLGPSTAALERALEMARRLRDVDREARECNSLGIARREAGDVDGARQLIERSIELARQTGNRMREATALSNMVPLCLDAGDYRAGMEAARRSVELDRELGDPWGIAIGESNLVSALLFAEGPEPAYRHLLEHAAPTVALADTELSIAVLESAAMVLAALGDAESAATLVGATQALRKSAGMPATEPDQRFLDRFIDPARDSLPRESWSRAYSAGTGLAIEDALAVALSHELAAEAVASRR